MPEHELWFTTLLNKLFAGPAAALLTALGIHVEDPAQPLPNHIAMQVLVALIIMAVFLFLRTRLSMDRPGKMQHFFEVFFEFLRGQAEEIVGHHGHRFVPLVMSIGLFILFSNLIGLVPGFESPTQHIQVTLGCAMVAFLYYHYSGVRHQGLVHYIKHFGGPVVFLAPLMFIIEIFSHLGRPLSLSVRLFANMFARELITVIFFGLFPVGLPMVFMGLHVFVAFLQAYIFMLLTMVYLQGAVGEEH